MHTHSKIIHVIGNNIHGVEARLKKYLYDHEYQHLMQYTGGILPADVKVWSLTEDELEQGSDLVKKIRKLPFVINANPVDPHPDPAQYIRSLREIETRRERLLNSPPAEVLDKDTFAKIVHYKHHQTPFEGAVGGEATPENYSIDLGVLETFADLYGVTVLHKPEGMKFQVTEAFLQECPRHVARAKEDRSIAEIIRTNDSMLGPLKRTYFE